MKNTILPILLVLFLFSCSNNNQIELPESEVIAIVGDKEITADLFNAFLVANGVNSSDEKLIQLAFETLLNEVAMSNIATKKKLPLSADQINTLRYLELRTHSKNAQTDYLSKNTVTEEEILKEYDKAKEQTKGLEFYVHHMLFKDEVEAIKTIDLIKTPAEYLQQEKIFLETNQNTNNVGDLGWVSLSQLPPSFKDKLLLTLKDSVVPEVVISPYGAHIVYLKDTRELRPPPLEQVREGIIKTINQQKISKFKQLAKAKAHIQLKK